ncbi:MAG TPA: hypothetical protein H9881_06045 [Candidatus Stackebrandtia excrementipullorum]|nr:hypothetical protein [Candidatus Stackebrandtia excrementipullorum]
MNQSPTMPAPPAPPGERPASAGAAGALILTAVGLALTAGAMLLIPEASRHLDDSSRFGMAVFGVANIITALGFIALALGVLRGRNGARITSFVVFGFAMLFNLCLGGIMLAVGDAQELPWQAVTFTVAQFALLFIDLAVIITLCMGDSSRWFTAMSRARRAGAL